MVWLPDRKLYSSILYRFQLFDIDMNNIVTVKSGLVVTQGHLNWYHLKALVRFPIRLP